MWLYLWCNEGFVQNLITIALKNDRNVAGFRGFEKRLVPKKTNKHCAWATLTCLSWTLQLTLVQQLSTWGTRTPRGTWEAHRGMQNFRNHSEEAHFGRIFDLGVSKGEIIWFGCMQRGTILSWGYVSTKRLRTLWPSSLPSSYKKFKEERRLRRTHFC